MEVQNNNAARRIIDYIDSNLNTLIAEQIVPRLESIAEFDKSGELKNSVLIRIVRMLLDDGVFVASEVIGSDESSQDEDIIYVTKSKSLGILNSLLDGTIIRVIPWEDTSRIVTLLTIED